MFSNPFKFGKEVAGKYFYDREERTYSIGDPFLAKYLNESPIEVGVPAETTMEAAKP